MGGGGIAIKLRNMIKRENHGGNSARHCAFIIMRAASKHAELRAGVVDKLG